MNSKVLTRLAKTATLLAALGMTSMAFAEGQASRKSDAKPIGEYSLPKDRVQPVSKAEYHRHKGKYIRVPHAAKHRRSASGLPYTGLDYSGRLASENKRKFFGSD